MLSGRFRVATLIWATFLTGAGGVSAEQVSIAAAGSLRGLLTELSNDFKVPAGSKLNLRFGPSGLLRDSIASASASERPALFFSASMEHPRSLVNSGHMASDQAWLTNSLCLMARPGVSLGSKTDVELMLDPALRLATSTPGADPAGDYTWQMFRRVDALSPGSFEHLDKRALRLFGGSIPVGQTHSPYAQALLDGATDLIVSYCTNAAEAAQKHPTITYRALSAEIDVKVSYGVAVSEAASPLARDFLRFVQGGRARSTIVRYGFGIANAPCDGTPTFLSDAAKAWSAPGKQVLGEVSGKGGALEALGQKLGVSLQAFSKLDFARAKPGVAAEGFGAAVAFEVKAPGRIEVFSDQRAWIDLLDPKGVALASIRSDRWLGCAGVNKNLGFSVTTPGRYVLQLSQIEGPKVTVLVAPLASTK